MAACARHNAATRYDQIIKQQLETFGRVAKAVGLIPK